MRGSRPSRSLPLFPPAPPDWLRAGARFFFSRLTTRPPACLIARPQQLGLQMIGEASALGLVMGVLWRISHANEKAQYDKYYANLRASLKED